MRQLVLVALALLWPLASAAQEVPTLSAGGFHACLLTPAGGVQCWGWNTSGQLGGTSTDVLSLVKVSGLEHGIKQIAAGYEFNCALTQAGGVKCWGNGKRGQLGSGPVPADFTTAMPQDVVGLASGVTQVTAGREHACALMEDGTVKCWGSGLYGTLGTGPVPPNTVAYTPVDVPVNATVKSISAGNSYTCAVTVTAGLRCWGFDWGTVSANPGITPIPVLRPTDITGLTSGVAAVSVAASHTCALTQAGGVKCWGNNYHGSLGDGTNIHRMNPVNVVGLTAEVKWLEAGGYSACAVTTNGVMQCWGYNYNGQLGNPDIADAPTPVAVAGTPAQIAAIAVGDFETCVLGAAGEVKCAGFNEGPTLRHVTTIAGGGVASPPSARAIEYYHAGMEHYFITASPDEQAALDTGTVIKGWTRTGESFGVEATPAVTTSAVCRFFSADFAPKSSHFYSASAEECATLRNNPVWHAEGTAFFIATPDATGHCATEVPIYRLYNNGQGAAPNHRFTTNLATRSAMLAKGWIPEGFGIGVSMCAAKS